MDGFFESEVWQNLMKKLKSTPISVELRFDKHFKGWKHKEKEQVRNFISQHYDVDKSSDGQMCAFLNVLHSEVIYESIDLTEYGKHHASV